MMRRLNRCMTIETGRQRGKIGPRRSSNEIQNRGKNVSLTVLLRAGVHLDTITGRENSKLLKTTRLSGVPENLFKSGRGETKLFSGRHRRSQVTQTEANNLWGWNHLSGKAFA